MRIVSLFCGAGGIDEGLRQAGYKTSLAIDSDKDACASLKANHPEAEVECAVVADMKSTIGKADMVVGGPPCPEFSTANVVRTNDPTEVNLFWKIVKETKARYWLMENVRGVQAVLGHRTDGHLVCCADYGVPQMRYRMIYSNLPVPARTHSRDGGVATLDGGVLKKWVSVGEALGLDGILRDNMARTGVADRVTDTAEPGRTVIAHSRFSVEDRKHQDGVRSRPPDEPAPVIHTDARMFLKESGHTGRNAKSMARPAERPAPTIDTGGGYSLVNVGCGNTSKHVLMTEPADTIMTQSHIWLKKDRDAAIVQKIQDEPSVAGTMAAEQDADQRAPRHRHGTRHGRHVGAQVDLGGAGHPARVPGYLQVRRQQGVQAEADRQRPAAGRVEGVRGWDCMSDPVLGHMDFAVSQSVAGDMYVLTVKSIDWEPAVTMNFDMQPPTNAKYARWHAEIYTDDPTDKNDWEAKIRKESSLTFQQFVTRFHGWKGSQIRIPQSMFEQIKKEARQ